MSKKKKKRKKVHKKPKVSPHQTMLETPTSDIINAMNYMLKILNDRGVKLIDWDDQNNYIGAFRMLRGKHYYLVGKIKNEKQNLKKDEEKKDEQ